MLVRVIFGEIVRCSRLNIGKYHMHAYIAIPLQEYYWWIKFWQFCSKISNHQRLLLTNISSYTILNA